MTKEFVYLNGKAVGWIEECEFYTPKRPEHIMRIYGGFGMNIELLAILRNRGFQTINFLYERKDGGIDLYLGTVTQFFNSIHEYHWNGEHQKFVKLSELILKKSPAVQQSSLEAFV